MTTDAVDRASLAATPVPPEGSASAPGHPSVWRRAAWRLGLAPVILGLLTFLPAGTLAYWQAWLYIGLLMSGATAVILIVFRNDPEFAERRMRMKERQATQRWVLGLGMPLFLALFIVPALDVRFGWSRLPWWSAVLGDLIVIGGYALVGRVFAANRFAGRIVEVEAGQQLISSGPYAVIRHPMYFGVTLLYGATPLALGSSWGLLAVVPLVLLLVFRIRGEEALLRRDLPGYSDYCRRVRWRLLPGLW